jgi:hypothetical protein
MDNVEAMRKIVIRNLFVIALHIINEALKFLRVDVKEGD